MEKEVFLCGFGQRIKKLRLEKDMSLDELANRCGYTSENSRSTVQKIEAGKSDVPVTKIKKIAEVLGTSIDYLMGWEDAPAAAPAADPLHKKIDRLDDVDKIRTEAYVDGLLSADKYQKNTSAGTA